MEKVPILLYHTLCSATDKTADARAVTFENFKQQMEYLHHNGFIGISLERFVSEMEYWKEESSKDATRDSRKKVILTFDDGDISHYYYALPTLKDLGFSATFFVTINEIGKPGRMEWPMVYDLTRSGMDVGSHGLTHAYLTAHHNYTILNELLLSKQVLEKYIRRRVNFLSVPGGFFSKQVLAIAKDVGFKAVCVADPGFNDFSDEKLFALKRFTIRRSARAKTVRQIANGAPPLVLSLEENSRMVLRNALGYQVYDKMRALKNRRKKEEREEK